MNYCRIFVIISIPLLIINLYAVAYDISWLVNISKFLIYIPLLLGFCKQLNFKNSNILAFFGASALGSIMLFFQESFYFRLAGIFFSMLSYIFLIHEALKYTKRETANRYMLTFFFILIAANVYFVSEHLQELENYLGGITEFAFYSVYYINLFVLSLVALVYYLNSYSRKSVFFISLVMALVVSDILRDMAFFYLPDTSVLVLNAFLHFGAILLALQFFITKEKKLRLINLL